MFQQMKDGEIRLVAAALAFSTVLSLVPFLAVTLSVFKSIGGLEFLYPKVEAFLLSYLEQGTGKQSIYFIQKILKRIHAGALGTTGAIALFISSFKLLQDMERGINRVWNVKEPRPFYRRVALNLCLFVIIPMGLAVYGGFRSLSFFKPLFKTGYRGITDFVMLFLGLLLIYKLVPYIKVRIRPALLSAVLGAALLLGLKNSFTYIAREIFNYSKVYGSLAAVPILCLWILGVWYILLGGVAFCASSQRRKWLEDNHGLDLET
jgi:membrane protein